MNRKEITRLCSQAIDETKGVDSPLFRFAALVAAAEREACAEWAELVAREIDDTNGTATYIAKGIRARGNT